MEKITEWILGLAIGALAVLVKAKMNSYDATQKEHDEDIAYLKTVAATNQQRITDHEKIDTERFERIEAMFTELRSVLLNGRRIRP